MSFYFDPLSSRNWGEQLQRHHDQTNLIRNIDGIVRTQTAEHDKTLRELSAEQADIMRASTEAICGTISEGFAEVTEGLCGIQDELYGLRNLFDTHMRTMIGELRYNNVLSQNIALLLREPDSEKVRQRNIEKGLKFYRDAILNPFFYDDALLFLKRAVDGETGDHTDYFVLHVIGLIHLQSKKHLDYQAAIDYLQRAATYAEADTHPDTKRLANILVGDVTRPLEQQERTVEGIRYLAGDSYLQISIAFFEQAQITDAIGYAERAYSLEPSLLEAGYWLAKSLAAAGRNAEAAEKLKPVIKQNEVYSLRTVRDPDLATKPEIRRMCEELRQEEEHNSQALYQEALEFKNKAIKEWKIMESSLAPDFDALCRNVDIATASIEKDRYLSYLRAQKHLDEFISKLWLQ